MVNNFILLLLFFFHRQKFETILMLLIGSSQVRNCSTVEHLLASWTVSLECSVKISIKYTLVLEVRKNFHANLERLQITSTSKILMSKRHLLGCVCLKCSCKLETVRSEQDVLTFRELIWHYFEWITKIVTLLLQFSKVHSSLIQLQSNTPVTNPARCGTAAYVTHTPTESSELQRISMTGSDAHSGSDLQRVAPVKLGYFVLLWGSLAREGNAVQSCIKLLGLTPQRFTVWLERSV